MTIFSVGGSTPSDSAVESKSLRFDDASSSYFSRTPTVAGNTKTWSLSFWRKQESGSNTEPVLSCGSYSGGITTVYFNASGALSIADYSSSAYNVKVYSNAKYRDPSSWSHYLVVFDSTQATSTDRVRIYKDGTRVTDIDSNGNTFPSQNFAGEINTAALHMIGRDGSSSSDYGRGYLAEMFFLDGTALDGASDFGETDSDTNQWKPKTAEDIKAAVTFGNNGFYLPFSNDALATSFTDASRSWNQEQTYTVPAGKTSLEVLVVAGGGAGGNGYAGGGGAGGIVHHTNFAVTPGDTLPVIVGAGGAASNTAGPANKGGDSVFSTMTATGGGGGGTSISASSSGGSGGGGGMVDGTDGTGAAAGQPAVSGATVYANAGGNGEGAPDYTAGGGGGAAAAGSNSSGNAAGPGGAGQLFSNFTAYGTTSGNVASSGSNGGYFGGGGGGSYNTSYATSAGTGGVGGGGNGRELSAGNGYDGLANTGGGGGGGGRYWAPVSYSGAGGSGTVIVYDGTTYTQFYTYGTAHSVTVAGDVTNERISNHNVTANGHAHIIGPKVGSSAIAFDGDGDYLNAASSTDFDFGSGAFTVEGWYNMTAPDSGGGFAGMGNRQGSSPYNGWMVEVYSGTMYFYFHNGSNINVNWSWTPQNNRWYHIAFARSGNLIDFWIDGVSQGSKAITGTLTASDAGFKLGGQPSNSSYDLNGYADEQRISNVARYTLDTDFTPATTAFANDSNTKLLIHSNTTMGSTTFTDSSSGGHTITKSGTPKHVVPKIGTGMGAFDGTGDYLSAADSVAWDFLPSSGYTVEAWVSMTTHAGTDFIIGQSVNGNNYWMLGHEDGAGLRFESYSGGSLVLNITGGEITDSNWHHIALVRDGNDIEIFKDGASVATGTTSSTATFAGELRIGEGAAHGAMDGYVDEVRISNTARYTSSFTPSTTAFTDDIDTLLLLHTDGGGPGTQGSSTNIGQGTYFYDDATNAIFYDSGVPKYKSIIKFDGSGDYLSLADSSDWDMMNTTDYTVETWANLTTDAGTDIIITQYEDSNNYWGLYHTHGSGVRFLCVSGGSTLIDISGGEITSSGWHHLAVVKDGNDFEVFKDGVSVATGTNSTTDTFSGALRIGDDGTGIPYDGYLDQIRISNSARYTSTFTPPTDRFTSDANTKLLIHSDFTDGGIGADHSGNYNYFTPNNLGAEDMVEDSPTNNFATLNPLMVGGGNAAAGSYLTEGNLRLNPGGANWARGVSTFGATSGKWYAEVYVGAMTTNGAIGIRDDKGLYHSTGASPGSAEWGPETGGHIYLKDLTTIDNVGSFAAGDIVSIAVDMDAGTPTVQWRKNNAVLSGGASGAVTMPVTTRNGFVFYGAAHTDDHRWNFGQDSSFAGVKTSQGNQDGNGYGDFYYAPPSGFLALCVDNLPTASIADPTAHFNTVTYAGDDATSRSITGVGFQPDFSWIKNRTSSCDHVLFDVVRGVADTAAGKQLSSNLTSAEPSNTNGHIKSFDSDGFSLRDGSSGSEPRLNTNKGSTNYASWNWKAGGTASSNGDGSITSSVSANTTAGFSIVSYTGTGSTATVGHGLSVAPEFLVVKNRTTASTAWQVGSDYLPHATPWSRYVTLSSDAAETNSTQMWNDTAPTSSVFTIKDAGDVNTNTNNYIAYCFHSVDGYSKVGNYAGNNSTDGVFVYTGFRPAWVLIKSMGSGESWSLIDNKRNTYNYAETALFPNLSMADTSQINSRLDMLSNGFKLRSNYDRVNGTGYTYLYLAFAESPFKTSNAR